MLGASSFRRPARVPSRLLSLILCSRGLLALGAPLACVPERALSSYVGGTASSPALDGDTGGNLPELPDAAAPVPEPDAGRTVGDEAVVAQDAALPPALLCRPECACERRGAGEFMFCSGAVSFEQALALCGGAGGALVSVEDEEQNTWLSQRMQELEADDFWLSGTDVEVEGVWRWSDGRVFFGGTADAGGAAAFAPWGDQQPNDLNGEDCMRSTGGVWRDLDCTDELPFVCEG